MEKKSISREKNNVKWIDLNKKKNKFICVLIDLKIIINQDKAILGTRINFK